MVVELKKRSVMTLYSDTDPYCHQVRIVLAEKGVTVDVLSVTSDQLTEELAELNPYHTVPTLVDRSLVLYQAGIIMEYLDERFPHPPLMPVYPVVRAECRRMMYRIEKDWYSLMNTILHGTEAAAKKARKSLEDSFINVMPAFAEKPYFLSDEFTLTDCCLAPMLWRLPMMGIELPAKAKPLFRYAERLFERASFKASLSEPEREMRPETL